MSPIDVQSIGQIMLTVSDLDRSLTFYRDVLGLEQVMSFEEQGMAFLRCGDLRLYLTDSADGPRSRPLLYYRVQDIQRQAQQLESAGVKSLAPPHMVHRTEESELWLAFFEDPDGLTFGLMEEVAGKA
jgi:catechol 2,3-dioxygenase-like lactoylglutathione lyase family enzyme